MIEQTALASLLTERLVEWDKARKGQEQKLLECYQDVMRIPRDDDTSGTGTSKTRKTKSLFMGSSRNKVRSARAKINDALFGNGEMPFDTTPSNEELAPYADAMEDILTKQMTKMKFKRLLKGGVNTLAKYGTGFIFGPFVRKETHTEVKPETVGGQTILKEEIYEYDCPYFELGNTLDVFPDPEAREVEEGLGVFWVTMMSPHTIRSWKDREGYKNIESALTAPDADAIGASEQAGQLRANVEYWHKNDRIKVARFFGKIPKHSLSVWNAQGDVHDTTKEEGTNQELVDAIVIMAGGQIVKVDEKPYAADYCPVLRCAYEDEEHEMWGVGVAENNAPHQKVTNAAFRLFMEGKGMALLGTSTVDRSKFLPTEDFKKFPGKVYQTRPGLSPEERKEAIIHHVEPDITGGWLDVIRMSEQFSDDDTAITKYTQGDDASNLNKTAHGISMIMSAGSLPFKDVISNIDEAWIVRIVKALIDWNIKYLEVETVQKIHGDKTAQIWGQIKQFGKASFMDWKATGTSSFMQKEVLVGKIRAFSEFAMSNPATASKIDVTELLNQTWNAMEVGKESPVLQEDGDMKIPPQVQQKMQQMEQENKQLAHALENAAAEHDKAEQALKSKGADTAATLQAAQIKTQTDAQATMEKAQIDAQTILERSRIEADAARERSMIDVAGKVVVAELANRAAMQQAIQPDAITPEPSLDTQAMMADAMTLIAQTMAQMNQPQPPMQIIHQRDPQSGLLMASYEAPLQ